MSLIAYTLLMFGCADDGTACEKIAAPTAIYSASATCEAQVETVLKSDTALRADYPLIEARCVKVARQAAAKPHGERTLAAR